MAARVVLVDLVGVQIPDPQLSLSPPSVRSVWEHTFVSDGANKRPKRSPGETRRLVEELRGQGFSYSQIARKLGMKKSTVAYHARRLGEPADERFAKRYDWGEIQAAYNSGLTVRQCMEQFGFTSASWHKAVKREDVRARPRSRGI